MPESFPSMTALGWKPAFQQQLTLEELENTLPARVTAVHKGSVVLAHEHGALSLQRSLFNSLPDITVGDWVLLDQDMERPVRLLERSSLVKRRSAGVQSNVQLIAANVDVLLIVTSCNQDFNPARLERYLALAYESGVLPVVVLTKTDLCEDTALYLEPLTELHAGLDVEPVNALDTATLDGLKGYCTPGTTLAMVGSSGVGKSTLANALGVEGQVTATIREDDAKGRHTTTARTLHPVLNDSVLIDMPGMREIQLAGGDSGLEELFDDLKDLGECRFSDCTHTSEPGCVVLEAIESGRVSQRRLDSYHKLMREQQYNAESIAERHERARKTGKFYKSVMSGKRRMKDSE
jgi:ribosome biogenesis GTPase